MKIRFLSRMGLGGTIGLALVMGCSNQSAQQDQTRTVPVASAPVPVAVASAPVAVAPTSTDASPPILMTAAPPVRATSPFLSDTASAAPANETLTAPVIEHRADQTAPPAAARVSPAVEEIIKMAQAGVSEEVMLSYIDNAQHPFNLNSDGVVYLNDLGVTAGVITSMIQKDAQLGTAPLTVAPAVTTQTQVVSNVVGPGAELSAQPGAESPGPPPTYVTAPADDTAVAYYYDALAPYGSWLYVSGYGWCWQPTVVVNNVGWQPYCDAGRWYWSDSGWYWHSDYSWGWAPFHYGRWYHHGHAGWLWCPGTVWGPAWVSWRYTDGYCGWAPLPPAAGWRAGVGFTWYGSSVSVGFDFGLSFGCYAWIPATRFCDYNVRRYCEPHDRARSIHEHSTVINNYVVGRNNTIINNGVGHDTIARQVGTGLREVTVRERPQDRIDRVRPEQLRKEGPKLVVDRPALPRSVPRVPEAIADRSKARPVGGSMSLPATPARSGVASFSGSRAPATVVPEARPGRTGSSSSVTTSSGAPVNGTALKPRPSTGPARSDNVVVGPAPTSSSVGRSSLTTTPTRPAGQERPSIYIGGGQKSSTPQVSSPAAVSSGPVSGTRPSVDPGHAAKSSTHDAGQPAARGQVNRPVSSGPATVTARPETRAMPAPSYQPQANPVRPPSPFRQAAPEPRADPAPSRPAPAYTPPAPSHAPAAPAAPSHAPSSGGQSRGGQGRSK